MPRPPLLDEARGRCPCARGIVGACVKRADAVLAHHVEREPLDRVMIEDQTGRHDEEIIRQRLAAIRRDALRHRIDRRHPLGEQRDAIGQPVGRLADDIARRLEARGHQREARHDTGVRPADRSA